MNGKPVRFLADANLNEDIIFGLHRLQPDIVFLDAQDIDLRGVPDDEVLAIAAREGCVLVTHDSRTMPTHFGNFLAAGQHSSGVIIVPQLAPMRAVIDTLLLIWRAGDSEDWVDRIDRIPW